MRRLLSPLCQISWLFSFLFLSSNTFLSSRMRVNSSSAIFKSPSRFPIRSSRSYSFILAIAINFACILIVAVRSCTVSSGLHYFQRALFFSYDFFLYALSSSFVSSLIFFTIFSRKLNNYLFTERIPLYNPKTLKPKPPKPPPAPPARFAYQY